MTDKTIEKKVQERTSRETDRDETLRKERIPRHEQNSLTAFNLDENFVYRWVNDVYGRISSFLAAGWEIAEGNLKDTFSGKGRQIEAQKSSQIWRRVNERNDAPCHEAALMRIRKEWYQDDQAKKLDKVASDEKEIDPEGIIRTAQLRGPQGNLIKKH